MPLISLPKKSQAPITTRAFFKDEIASPIISSISHVPELLLKAMPFIGQALGPSSISLRTKEIMILRASAQLDCTYCINTHTFVCIQAKLSHKEISALRGEISFEEIFTDSKERLLIKWTDAMADSTAPISSTLKEKMVEHYSEAEIVEFSLCIGATIMLNRYATALSLPVDPHHILTLEKQGFSIVS